MEAALAGNAIDRASVGINHSTSMLKRIAKVLEEPEAVLFGKATSSSDLDDTCEMLRVWHALKGAQDRWEVLAFAHAVAAKAEALQPGMQSASDQSRSAVDGTGMPIAAVEAKIS